MTQTIPLIGLEAERSPVPEGDGLRPTHRHVKRGSEYVLIGFGKMQAEDWIEPGIIGLVPGGSVDMREVAIYRSVDDCSLWVRPREEFEDGRFVALASPAPVKAEAEVVGWVDPLSLERLRERKGWTTVILDVERRESATQPLYATPSSGGRREALECVWAERERQKSVEGWTPEHDDTHTKGEMATAAGIYALVAGSADRHWVIQGLSGNDYIEAALRLWPWDRAWLKPTDRRRDLVKAGALIIAEIERLDRALANTNPTAAE
jgi:hypothetical protein